MAAPAHDAAGEAALLGALGARLERLGLGANLGDLVPVGKALGQLRHGAASLRSPSRLAGPASNAARPDSLGPRSRPLSAAQPLPRLKSSWSRRSRGRISGGCRRLYVHDLVLQRAARSRDLDGLALLAADDRAADGRLVRELVLGRVGLGRADDEVLDRLVRVQVLAGGRSCRSRRRPWGRPPARSRGARASRSSSCAIFCSTIACSFFASSYSEFSEMSPNSRACLIRSATSRRLSVVRYSSSSVSFSKPSGVSSTSFTSSLRDSGFHSPDPVRGTVSRRMIASASSLASSGLGYDFLR